ncbi:MAG: hypothetical protein HY674_16995 [Chloroflexi bacterium]|nr:hypothetical protein [Chloroflexota bacterium]
MANLSEKVEAELEQVEQALRELPGARRMSKLSVLELAGTASLLQVQDRGEPVRAGASEGLTAFQAASPDQAEAGTFAGKDHVLLTHRGTLDPMAFGLAAGRT